MNDCVKLVFSLFDSLKFLLQYQGYFVIMEIYKSLFAKSFDLGSEFNFLKGFLAIMQVIMILAALLHFSPKL